MTSTLSRPRPAPAPSPPPTRRWRHLPLAVLLAATAALYLWGLSASGRADAFYAAAAQAGGAQHRIHWFIGSAGTGTISTASGGSDDARLVAEWVAATFPARTVDGVALHDLGAS